MLLLILILSFFAISESKIWTKDYVNELLLLKNHLDEPIEKLFNDLFKHMKTLNNTIRLQAFSLDTLSRIFSTGAPFCHSFETMINHLINRIHFLLLRNKNNDPYNELGDTVQYLNKKTVNEIIHQCNHYLNHNKDSSLNHGILSDTLATMNTHRKEAQKKLTINMT